MNKKYFVSYGHTDIDKTEAIIRFLTRCGLDIWYDGHIRLYHDWNEEIRSALNDSDGLILIATNDAVRRPVVVKEVRTMMERDLPVYVICLENIRLNGLEEPLHTLIMFQQYVMLRRYNTMTLRGIAESIQQDHPLRNMEPMPLSDYINTNSDPRPVYENGRLKYHRIELADILPYSGTLMEFDDQWYPPELYQDGRLYTQDPQIRRELQAYRAVLQKQEFLRALLHSRQILVNRASFQNSLAFRSIYEDGDDAQKDALRSLLDQGALVLVLMNEDPYRDTIYQSDRRSWSSFLLTCQPYFMKFDWDSEAFNKQINETTLSEPFGTAMMNLYAHKYAVEEWIRRYHIQDTEAFRSLLADISDKANAFYKINRYYNRTHLYRDFVTVDEDSLPEDHPSKGYTVRDTIMDPEKPFAAEIKQIADEIYAMNFAYSHLCDLKSGNMYLQKTDGTESQYSRVIYADELTSFLDSLLHRTLPDSRGTELSLTEIRTIPALTLDAMCLEEIAAVRRTMAWEEYITAVEFLKKRTYRWSLDDEGMIRAVRAYMAVLQCFPGTADPTPFALSVIFRLSSCVLTMVIRRKEETGEFEYVYTMEGSPPKDTSILHISFEVRDRLKQQEKPTPEANILICTGVTSSGCEPYVRRILSWLDAPEVPFERLSE